MSTGQFATSSSLSTTSSTPNNANSASKNSNFSHNAPSQSAASQFQAGPSTWQAKAAGVKAPKKKPRTAEENEIINGTAARFASRLAEDHAAVLNPDVDSPFVDTEDIVKRLLPYHIYLNPQEDLKPLVADRKGKSKAEELATEVEETKFALEYFKRRRKLQERFRNARIKSGETPYQEELIVLGQLALESDRSEQGLLQSEVRSARSELERLERAKRAANTAATTTPAPRTSYYATPLPATMPTGPTAYYRTYPYAYAQAYSATAAPPTVSTFSVNPVPVPQTTAAGSSTTAATPSPVAPSPIQTSVPSVAPTTTTVPPAPVPTSYTPGAPLPVQLPVASLPMLQRIDIVPVSPSSTQIPGQPPPAAVLRGTNGTMVSLEINISVLQPSQLSGLALILNSLMTRTNTATPVVPAYAPVPASAPSTNV